MKYRKKPIVIEAFQMTEGNYYNNSEWPFWLQMAGQTPPTDCGSLTYVSVGPGKKMLSVTTFVGTFVVPPGDWIIQGVNGELYPCKPDIFEKTYDVYGES